MSGVKRPNTMVTGDSGGSELLNSSSLIDKKDTDCLMTDSHFLSHEHMS
jgi:Cft2 family RNA processing exonuclease